MKIVQIEDFFHPDAGYQINILSKYFSKFGHQVVIISFLLDQMPDFLTGFFGKDNIEERDREYEKKYNVQIIRLPMKKYVSGRVIFDTKIMKKTILDLAPDILYVHGNDTFSGIWTIMRQKKLGCPIITDSHMVDIASRNKFRKIFYFIYKNVVTRRIIRERIKVIRTAEDDYVINRLGIPREQAPFISFGSDIMLFHRDVTVKQRFRIDYKIDDNAFIITYVGKLDEAKGGKFLAKLTAQNIQSNREIIFVIVGNTIGEYGETVERIFERSKYRILRFPTQKYSQLPKFYQISDLAIIPKQCSLSLYDMNATGLQVLAEDNEINIRRLSHNNGWTFQAGNLQDCVKNIENILKIPKKEYETQSKEIEQWAFDNYSYEKKAREYENEIQSTKNYYERRYI